MWVYFGIWKILRCRILFSGLFLQPKAWASCTNVLMLYQVLCSNRLKHSCNTWTRQHRRWWKFTTEEDGMLKSGILDGGCKCLQLTAGQWKLPVFVYEFTFCFDCYPKENYLIFFFYTYCVFSFNQNKFRVPLKFNKVLKFTFFSA